MPALSERNLSWDIFWDRHRIDYDGWDTHTRNFPILKDWNLPQFDQTLSALIADQLALPDCAGDLDPSMFSD